MSFCRLVCVPSAAGLLIALAFVLLVPTLGLETSEDRSGDTAVDAANQNSSEKGDDTPRDRQDLVNGLLNMQDILTLDDSAFALGEKNQVVQKQLEQNALETSKVERERRALLQRIAVLREHVNKSKAEVEQWKAEELKADDDLKFSQSRGKTLQEESKLLSEHNTETETELQSLNQQLPSVQDNLTLLEKQLSEFDEQRQKLQNEENDLITNLQSIVSRFQDDELLAWLEANTKDLSPVLRATILRMYKFLPTALEPVKDGIDSASELDSMLSRQVGVESSFIMGGTVFQILLLTPTVLAIWVILKIKARLAMITVDHCILAFAFYFCGVTTTCFGVSLVARMDALVLFHRHFGAVADTIIIGHVFLFLMHFVLQALRTFATKTPDNLVVLLGIFTVGKTFFSHGYGRVILGHEPDIGLPGYLVYLSMYILMIVYNRYGSLVMEEIRSRRSKSKNSSIAAPVLPKFAA